MRGISIKPEGVSRFQTAGLIGGGPHLLKPFYVETLDFCMFRRLAPWMGIISKSVDHACLGGARGLLRPRVRYRTSTAAGVVKFYQCTVPVPECSVL